ncbi:MAG: hypothetical protein LBF54_02680 [Holosporaceae bacterium]|jgi:hypothetical protein|nr:hypothetical protein [Holosporaceae bacterium]
MLSLELDPNSEAGGRIKEKVDDLVAFLDDIDYPRDITFAAGEYEEFLKRCEKLEARAEYRLLVARTEIMSLVGSGSTDVMIPPEIDMNSGGND